MADYVIHFKNPQIPRSPLIIHIVILIRFYTSFISSPFATCPNSWNQSAVLSEIVISKIPSTFYLYLYLSEFFFLSSSN